jgi:hypothetical protein
VNRGPGGAGFTADNGAVSATSDSAPAGSVAASQQPVYESARIVPIHEAEAIVIAAVRCVQARVGSETALAARRELLEPVR